MRLFLQFIFGIGYIIGGSEWFVKMETKRLFAFIPFVFFVGVAVYTTLFTIWAIINAYHHKRLNIGWIIVFALFNAFGYLVYYLAGKRATTN
ncbi:hypothetical protein BSNK01_00920 [Bacillaceae bacterium]